MSDLTETTHLADHMADQAAGNSAETGLAGNPARCPNCQTPISGPYCATCGQSQKTLNKQVWTLAGELLDDVFRLDSRAARTMFALFFRPGFLTTEFFAGRKARYSPPIRLYLVISFLFFFLAPMLSELDSSVDPVISIETDAGTTEDAGKSDNVDAEEPDWADNFKEEFSGIQFDWLSEEENKRFNEKAEKQLRKTQQRLKDDPAELTRDLMDLLSGVMFFMLPLFAVFLKLAYLGSGVYYAEHLLLAVHNHCFLFTALLLSATLKLFVNTELSTAAETMDAIVQVWILVYIYLSLRKTFNQSYLLTAFKFFTLSVIYGALAITGLVVAMIIGVMTL